MANMANGKRIQSIECSDIETKPCLDKKRVYRLLVTWFDGAQTHVEATTSTFSNLKTRLKNECYLDRPDITVPDVPAARPLDAVVGLKKTDRKKKAIYDFFEQVLSLPDVPAKWRIMSEMFGSPYERRQPAAEYAMVKKTKPVPQPPSVYDLATAAGDDDDADGSADADTVLQYADIDFSKLPSSTCNGKTGVKLADAVPNSPTLYAEIVHKVSAAAAAGCTQSPASDVACAKSSIPVVAGNGDGKRVESLVPTDDERTNRAEDCSSSTKEHLYLNVPQSGRRCYENWTDIVDTGKTRSEPKIFRVAETYIPNTCHSQGLAVEAGDLVQVEVESGGRAFCTMCVDGPLRPMEGWLPTNILRPCSPDDGLESCRAVGVGVDEVDGKLEDPGSAVERKKPTAAAAAFPRPAPRNNKQLEIKINADTQILDLQRQQSLSPIPSMPSMLSPMLKIQPEVREFEERLCLTVVTSQATAATSKSPIAARRGDPSHPAAPVASGSSSSSSSAAGSGSASAIQAAAVADYTSGETGVLSFRAGDVGELIYTSDTNWWCIRRGEIHGWVPASYWRIVSEDGRVLGHRRTGSGSGCVSQHEVPWMIGKLSRPDCEQLMLKTGRQRDFVIRQSPNLCGQYALSILHRDRVHHFPIVPTNDGKFYIGKHHFSTIYNVVIYYAKNTLFADDEGRSVTLGRPFRIGASGK